MKNSKLLVVSALAGALVGSTSLHAQGISAQGFGSSIGYSYDGVGVTLPESIRTIPAHPDDGGGALRPMTQSKFDANHGFEISAGYLFAFESQSLRHRIGLGARWLVYPAGITADMDEESYKGGPGRGSGHALTFVSFGRYGVAPSVSPIVDVFTAWTPTVKYEVGPSSGRFDGYALGVEVSYSSYRAVTGWDRHDRYEQDKSYDLAWSLPTRVYLSYHHPETQWGVNVGVQFQPMFKSDLEKESKLDAPLATGFASVGFRF